MKHRFPVLFLALSLAAAVAAAQGQRIAFPRQSFDRSRFGQPAAQPAVQPAAAPVAAPAPTAVPSSPSSSPNPPSFSAPAPSGASERVPDELVASPRWDLIPRKGTDNPKDYESFVDIQRQTGGIILIYFRNNNDSSEKGLCNWFEKSIASAKDWQKATRPYLKIDIALPGNSAAAALATRYKVQKTPAVFVHKPNSFPMRLSVFDWPNGEPKPRPVDEVIEDLLKLSTEAYKKYVPTIY